MLYSGVAGIDALKVEGYKDILFLGGDQNTVWVALGSPSLSQGAAFSAHGAVILENYKQEGKLG